jgi:hypothetical protein
MSTVVDMVPYMSSVISFMISTMKLKALHPEHTNGVITILITSLATTTSTVLSKDVEPVGFRMPCTLITPFNGLT